MTTSEAATSIAARPNIVLITTDQQRYDTVRPHAPDFMRTPHFDFLTREGVQFDRAYSDCPLCAPARTTLLTGRSALSHGMFHNGRTSDYVHGEGALPSSLRAAGYQTVAIGKMHFAPERARYGFDEMILPADYYLEMQRSGNPLQPMRHGLGQNELYPTMATVPESMTLTSWTAEQCVRFIRERRDPTKPFFLWCSFTKPHPPLDPPEPYYSMYRGEAIPEPTVAAWSTDPSLCPPAFVFSRTKGNYDRVPGPVLREARAAYYGLVTHCDYAMGRIFAALLDRGLLDDALIVATSDHGEYLGDHGAGAKGFFHDVSARVPFVMRLPKSWPRRHAGELRSEPVVLADLVPTFASAAGGAPPETAEGQDLIALVRGELAYPREYVIGACDQWSRHAAEGGVQYLAITDTRWKYIWYPEGGVRQLFDLVADPHEQVNLGSSSAHQAQIERLERILRAEVSRRRPSLLADGALPTRPLHGLSDLEIRSSAWPGFHTENYHVDVRH